jgi:hypothetical protein
MRALKLVLLILALVPTVYLRAPKPAPERGGLGLVDLMPALRATGALPDTGALRLVGAWQITGRPFGSGTFSGLAQTDGGFVAVGDRGALLRFTRPDRPGAWRPWLGRLINLDWCRYRIPSDAEAITVVPGSGDFLVGYEDRPALGRFSADLTRQSAIPVPALREWPPNQGPESLVILADGRTVIVGEGYAGWLDRTRHPGLLFPGLPRVGETPARFEVVMPAGFRPSEMTQMPDGRLLVLGRNFAVTGFRSLVAVLSPGDIRPGAVVKPRVIARITDPRIRENYEGMTVTREADGSQTVWLISDSNEMVWLQRTLLLKLRIGPEVR